MSVERAFRGATLFLSLSQSLIACDSAQRASSRPAVDQQPADCRGFSPVRLHTVAGGGVAVADIDCDGLADTLSIRLRVVDGVAAAELTVGARPAYRFATLDGTPQFVEAVDLDDDGLRDLVLAIVDESTVRPVFVKVGRDRLAQFDETALNWRTLQYIWAEVDAQDACATTVLPRAEASAGGSAVVVVSVSLGDLPCTRAKRIVLAVRDGRLIVDSAETAKLSPR